VLPRVGGAPSVAAAVGGMLEARGFRVNHCLVWDKAHFGMGTYWRNQHENTMLTCAKERSD